MRESVAPRGEVHGFDVDGIELSPEMLVKARARCPRGRFEVADMTSFHLGRRYDGMLCMSASIAYTVTLPRLREALACMRDHREPRRGHGRLPEVSVSVRAVV